MRYIAIVIAIFVWYATVREPIGSNTAMPTEIQAAIPVPAGARTLPAFELSTHTGDTFSNDDLTERWAVVMLGYSACESACPESLAAVAAARQTLLDRDAKHANGHWLMITLDPETDTAAALTSYLSGFSDAMTGLTGDVETLTRVVSVLTGGATPIPGQVWLLAPGGEVRARIDPPVDPDALPFDLRLLRAR